MARLPTTEDLRNVPAPVIGAFLLESITTGMYGERRNAIREYVQNSFDGIQAAIAAKVLKPGKGKVTVTIDGSKTLTVHDNGIGLGHRVAVDMLTAVGASRKTRGQQAGFRGIGRLAGIAISKEIRFRTKASGEKLETLVVFNCEKLREGMLRSGLSPVAELISESVSWSQKTAEAADDHYFEVSLINFVNAPPEARDTTQLMEFLAEVAPVDFHPDFSGFRKQIFDQAGRLEFPENENAAPGHRASAKDSDVLRRIPFEHVAVVVRSGVPSVERPVF